MRYNTSGTSNYQTGWAAEDTGFVITIDNSSIIKRADMEILSTEKDMLHFPIKHKWKLPYKSLNSFKRRIIGLDSDLAFEKFLSLCKKLGIE